MMAWRIAGRVGCGGGPLSLFSPSRLSEPAGLEEGVSDHRHQGVAMQSAPRPALEVVETELFLELLMRLFADPARLDGAGEHLERRLRRQIGEVVFALAIRAVLTDQPDFFTRHVLSPHIADALWRPVPASRRSGRQGVLWCRGAS